MRLLFPSPLLTRFVPRRIDAVTIAVAYDVVGLAEGFVARASDSTWLRFCLFFLPLCTSVTTAAAAYSAPAEKQVPEVPEVETLFDEVDKSKLEAEAFELFKTMEVWCAALRFSI